MITWTCETCKTPYFTTTNPSNMARLGESIRVDDIGEIEFRIHTGNTHRQYCKICELDIYKRALAKMTEKRGCDD